jgi:ABC-type nitrate/sulfonate/bicarbonate transport system permease component
MKSPQNLIRILLPLVVLAAGIAIWELVVRINDIQPYVLPGPVAVFTTLIGDWPVLSQSLAVTLVTRWKALSRPRSAAWRWHCSSTSPNGWNIRCFPMP